MKTTPVSKFERGSKMAKSATKIGIKKAVSFSKKAFASKEQKQKIDAKTDSEIGKILFENISLLKGTAVKIAQALSLHNILPSNIQKELEHSYNAITPINKALVIKILEDEFKKPYNKIFKSFNLTPFASASLGQVHLATLQDNTKVAVKIQYPNIDKTIKSDIALMKKLGSFKKGILTIIEEVEDRLYEEIDYTLELKNTKEAYKKLSSNNIIVPKVYPKYSTKHILTTEFIEGVELYKWLKTSPTARQKELIANAIFSVFTKSIFKIKTIQADPNPANYIVTKDNKLALIDFGCIKQFDNTFIENFKHLIQIYMLSDKEIILKAYKDMNFIDSTEQIDEKTYKKIVKFNKWSVKPYMQVEFIFTKEYLEKGVEFANLFTSKPFNVVKDYVFIDRTMHGLFSIFEQMGSKIDMREFREAVEIS